MSALTETLPRIWSWEESHPDWQDGDSWDPAVRCFAVAGDDGLVLIDPLITDWGPLDALAREHGGVRAIVRTLHFHQRTIAEAAARYEAPVYARPVPHDGARPHPYDVAVTNGQRLPGGVVAYELDRGDELALWLPLAGALLFSDVGQTRDGRFTLAPPWWVSPPDSWPRLRHQLAPLVALGAEHLLVCHGAQRLGGGSAALSAAIAQTAHRPLPPFVTPDQLDAAVKLVDVRHYLDGRSGAAAFEAAHLPGAVYLELGDVLAAPHDPEALHGRHPLPEPERFGAGLSAAGISDVDSVVAYDDTGGVIAARLVWMLRVSGHDAAVLHPVPEMTASGPVAAPEPARFTAYPWPAERLADINVVAERDPATVVIDARDPSRFGGGPDPVDPRSGHIPGAVNVPCRENVGLDPAALAVRFAAVGITADTDVISSCGSGVTACHNLLSMEYAGLGAKRLYPGGWSEWSRDLSRPIVTGTPPDPASP